MQGSHGFLRKLLLLQKRRCVHGGPVQGGQAVPDQSDVPRRVHHYSPPQLRHMGACTEYLARLLLGGPG